MNESVMSSEVETSRRVKLGVAAHSLPLLRTTVNDKKWDV
jgi:hypothetical protein